MKITFFAPDNTMGECQPEECEYFRTWAKQEIESEFPGSVISVINEDATYSVQCSSDDIHEYNAVNDFCCRLWDRCPWGTK